ncbi:hypothetical protein Tco_1510633, partial [Tanacetum coccineum]
NIRVILKVFTVKMEILLEPTLNKLSVGELRDSIRIKLVTTGKKRWLVLTEPEDLPIRYQDYQDNDCQRRLLASFQDDAKYDHVGQDTRSQGGKDDQDERIKI